MCTCMYSVEVYLQFQCNCSAGSCSFWISSCGICNEDSLKNRTKIAYYLLENCVVLQFALWGDVRILDSGSLFTMNGYNKTHQGLFNYLWKGGPEVSLKERDRDLETGSLFTLSKKFLEICETETCWPRRKAKFQWNSNRGCWQKKTVEVQIDQSSKTLFSSKQQQILTWVDCQSWLIFRDLQNFLHQECFSQQFMRKSFLGPISFGDFSMNCMN